MQMQKHVQKPVVPGEAVSTAEEFVPGRNVFEREGEILSNSMGLVAFDPKFKEVNVEKRREVALLDRGSIVYGRVRLVKESSVLIDIITAEKNGKKKAFHVGVAMIPVRMVAREYVESLKDFFRIGDLVKGKAEMVSPFAIDVSTNDDSLGVIKAYCSECRQPLHLFGQGLKCLSCGCTQQRKISSDYILK